VARLCPCPKHKLQISITAISLYPGTVQVNLTSFLQMPELKISFVLTGQEKLMDRHQGHKDLTLNRHPTEDIFVNPG
jgi:hypothetical protein